MSMTLTRQLKLATPSLIRSTSTLVLRPSFVLSKVSARTMSATTQPATQKHLFLVYAPDKTDDGAFARRLSVRPQHLEVAKAHGRMKMGGAMLTPESIEPGAERKMIGSTMVVVAESLADARELIESDVYYKSGVWDPEKLVITPFVAVGMTAE